MTRAAWLEERRRGLGSSDAAPVCGLSPYRTRLHVWMEKVHGITPPQSADNAENLRRRERAESFIAGEWEHETGGVLMIPGVNHPRFPAKIFVHPDYPWLRATPDRIELAGETGVELKTADSPYDGWGPVGSQVVPPGYFVQVQQQMATTGFQSWDIAVVFGRGWEFRRYTIQRDEAFIERLIEIEASFWAWVVARVPPPADWSHEETPALIAAIPGDRPLVERALDDSAVADALALSRVRAEIATLEKEKDRLRAGLLESLGGPGVGTFPGGRVVWKEHVVTRKPTPGGTSTRTDLRVELEEA